MTTNRLVILVHGIRTFGGWQSRLAEIIRKDPATKVIIYKHGYFNALGFLIPFFRWGRIRDFRDYVLRQSELHPGTQIDIVAHSFGTYMVARALRALSPAQLAPFRTLLLCGSVVKCSFNWEWFLGEGRRVINDCGEQDLWPVMAQFLVLGMGLAGRHGFNGGTGIDTGLINRFFPFGHSGFFEPSAAFTSEDDFMMKHWLPVLTGDKVPEGPELRPPKASLFTPVEQGLELIKLVLLLVPLALIFFVVNEFKTKAELQSRTAQIQSHLTKSSQLLSTDPAEAFLEALKADRLAPSSATQEAMSAALQELIDRLVWQRSVETNRTGGGLFSSDMFRGSDLVSQTRDHKRQVFTKPSTAGGADSRRELWLLNKSTPVPRLLPAGCAEKGGGSSQVSGLRFSHSENFILAARQSALYLYSATNGDLLAQSCRWFTKDYFEYLDLLQQDSVFFASANEGQIMFFRVDTNIVLRVDDKTTVFGLTNLTYEFQVQPRTGGGVKLLQASPDERLLLTVHNRGLARLWQWNPTRLGEYDYLKNLHTFVLPERLRPKKGPFDFKTPPEEFLVSASMNIGKQGTNFLTTFKTGPAIQWGWQSNAVREIRVLNEGGTNLAFATFSGDGNRILCLTPDKTVTILDSLTGTVIERKRF